MAPLFPHHPNGLRQSDSPTDPSNPIPDCSFCYRHVINSPAAHAVSLTDSDGKTLVLDRNPLSALKLPLPNFPLLLLLFAPYLKLPLPLSAAFQFGLRLNSPLHCTPYPFLPTLSFFPSLDFCCFEKGSSVRSNLLSDRTISWAPFRPCIDTIASRNVDPLHLVPSSSDFLGRGYRLLNPNRRKRSLLIR